MNQDAFKKIMLRAIDGEKEAYVYYHMVCN
jgi:hypothetical protein